MIAAAGLQAQSHLQYHTDQTTLETAMIRASHDSRIIYLWFSLLWLQLSTLEREEKAIRLAGKTRILFD